MPPHLISRMNAGIHHSKYCMPTIMTPSKMGKTKNLIFYSLIENVGFCFILFKVHLKIKQTKTKTKQKTKQKTKNNKKKKQKQKQNKNKNKNKTKQNKSQKKKKKKPCPCI